ncbi:hypothetical protein LEP1GSC125_1237 [Leptospira mayottensis 200901122]|uniref:Uncharacterized protein n=1 Tax=Leptospira mayottensis 200901122 TaxID=1193010 RepID=A0AA87MPX8_9LEPT|nr:hypothetical protein LEP1GSC125_1237 [Leptospira mayottensis 200901122]
MSYHFSRSIPFGNSSNLPFFHKRQSSKFFTKALLYLMGVSTNFSVGMERLNF